MRKDGLDSATGYLDESAMYNVDDVILSGDQEPERVNADTPVYVPDKKQGHRSLLFMGVLLLVAVVVGALLVKFL